MTDTAVRSQTPSTQPPSGLPHSPQRRRQLRLATVAFLIAVGCALAFALLFQSAGARQTVLAVARQVDTGAVIREQDLTVVGVSADPGLRTVPASSYHQVVGSRAAALLVAGSLLTPAHLDSRAAVAPGQAVVGIAVPPGELPADTLQPGDLVVVVHTGDAAEGGEGGRMLGSGAVFALEATDDATGAVRVSLLLPEDIAVDVASAASANRVRLIWVGSP